MFDQGLPNEVYDKCMEAGKLLAKCGAGFVLVVFSKDWPWEISPVVSNVGRDAGIDVLDSVDDRIEWVNCEEETDS